MPINDAVQETEPFPVQLDRVIAEVKIPKRVFESLTREGIKIATPDSLVDSGVRVSDLICQGLKVMDFNRYLVLALYIASSGDNPAPPLHRYNLN